MVPRRLLVSGTHQGLPISEPPWTPLALQPGIAEGNVYQHVTEDTGGQIVGAMGRNPWSSPTVVSRDQMQDQIPVIGRQTLNRLQIAYSEE
jgi:hypothetical protein